MRPVYEMDDRDYQKLVIRLFIRLRDLGFALGVGELLDALELLEGGWVVNSPEELRRDLRLFWRHTEAEDDRFNEAWEEALAEDVAPAVAEPVEPPPPLEDSGLEPVKSPIQPPEPSPKESLSPAPSAQATVLPVHAFTPARDEGRREISAYWPISRRMMAYGWRYLRRPLPDGPADVLDIPATVERAAREGFFLSHVYRRRERDNARLAMLVDQEGSMVPFHRFTRDLIETARAEKTLSQVEVYYFHNLLADDIYLDPHLTSRVKRDDVLAAFDGETSVLIVSDAGAARGFRRRERIRGTTAMISALNRRTGLLAWLNPMPADRWRGTSAEIIGRQIRMFQMNQDGFSGAIDVVRGLDTAP
jgi:hypothetical protein